MSCHGNQSDRGWGKSEQNKQNTKLVEGGMLSECRCLANEQQKVHNTTRLAEKTREQKQRKQQMIARQPPKASVRFFSPSFINNGAKK